MNLYTKKIKLIVYSQWKAWRGFILFFLLVFIPIRSSLADWNFVPSGSMNPTIMEGDLVYVNKLAYDLRIPLTLKRIGSWAEPKHGDIVVCFSPEAGTRLVKRIIARPGDKISMINNMVFINGKALDYERVDVADLEDLHELYSFNGQFYREIGSENEYTVMQIPRINTVTSMEEVTVPDDYYFVMGDNRDNSKDSRSFGFVNRKQIIGKATMVIGSLNKLEYYQPRFSRFFKVLE